METLFPLVLFLQAAWHCGAGDSRQGLGGRSRARRLEDQRRGRSPRPVASPCLGLSGTLPVSDVAMYTQTGGTSCRSAVRAPLGFRSRPPASAALEAFARGETPDPPCAAVPRTPLTQPLASRSMGVGRVRGPPSGRCRCVDLRTASPEPTGVSQQACPPSSLSSTSSYCRPPTPTPGGPLPARGPQQPLTKWGFRAPTGGWPAGSLPAGPPARTAWAQAPSGVPSPWHSPLVPAAGTGLIYGVSGNCVWECLLVFKLVMRSDPASTIRTLR